MSTAAQRYEFGPFRFVEAERQLLREGVVVPLTPKVSEALSILVKNAGRTVGKEELLKALWPDSFVEENNLAVHISALRKALGEGGEGQTYIETVPKRGYRFVSRVDVIGEESSDFQPRSNNGLSHNIPAPLTPLVGRESELATAAKLLRGPTVRLLTLVGPGGSGKTRLALEIARRLRGEFKDGAFFISLAPLGEPELVAPAVVRALGVIESGGRPLTESIKGFLRDKQVLLLFDNFEHVLRASSLVSEVLESSSGAKVLATSREPLRLRGEQELSVPPLPVPDLRREETPESLKEFAAVELFFQRARAVKSDFTINHGNAPVVAEICARLDGLPLAIELAAARVRHLSPAALLARLHRRFQLLTGGAQDLPARQQTMHAAVAWSYDLLSEAEKEVFRHLAAFAGGFICVDAEAVCAPSGEDCFGVLCSLLDKSLLQDAGDSGSEPRYTMLETIREYGRERLKVCGEVERAFGLHAQHFLHFAEAAEPELIKAEQAAFLDRLEREHNNLRSALSWTLDNDTATALRLAGALSHFWFSHNHFTEGRRWLGEALERCKGEPSPFRLKALLGAGHLARRQHDYGAARALFEESLSLSRRLGDRPQIAKALWSLGFVASDANDYATAGRLIEESLLISRELGDKGRMAVALNGLGEVARIRGDFEAARPLYHESLEAAREVGDMKIVAYVLSNLADLTYRDGDFAAVYRQYTESLVILQGVGDRWGMAGSLGGLARVAAEQGQYEHAALLLGAAESVYDTTGSRPFSADQQIWETAAGKARDSLGEEVFAEAFSRGRRLDLETVVREALAWPRGEAPSQATTRD